MTPTSSPERPESSPLRARGWGITAPVALALAVAAGTLWLGPSAVGREVAAGLGAVLAGLAAAGFLAAASARDALRRLEEERRRAQAQAAWRDDAAQDDSLEDTLPGGGSPWDEAAFGPADLPALIDGMGDAALLLDPDGWVIAANPAATAALGAAAAPEGRWDEATAWPAPLVPERRPLPGGGTLVIGRDPLRDRLRAAQIEAMDGMTELAGAIVHDVNNTLGAIAGYADFLVSDLPAGSPQADYAARILRAIDHNKSLLRRTLSATRTAPPELCPCDANHLLADAAAQIRAVLPPDAALSLREEPNLPAFPGNAPLLARALAALALDLRGSGNAALALRAAVWGGESDPATAPSGWRVHAPLLPHRHPHLMIELRVGGAPRPPQALRAALDPLLATRDKARQSAAEPPPALLSAVRWHEGGLVGWTHPAEGTVIRLFLPLTMVDAPPEAPEAPPVPRCHVLVVDDDPEMGDWLSVNLERLGCEVAVCESGAEALEIVMDEPASFDLVVAGPAAGGLTGAALIRRLKALRPDLACMLCSGAEEKPDAEAVPADLFLPRPVSLAGLSRAVATFAPAERTP